MSRDMILSIASPGDHDSNIALVSHEGEILFCINEERLSRVKKDGRFPQLSLEFKDKLFDNHQQRVFMLLPLEECRKRFLKAGIELQINEEYRRRMDFYKEIANGDPYFVSHHEAHAASAYYTSGFEEAYVVTMDCGNYCEPWNTTIYHGKNGMLVPLKKDTICMPKLYFFTTALIGFTPDEDEGKITGLAAYGALDRNALAFFEEEFNRKDNIAYEISAWKNRVSKEEIPTLRINTELIEKYKYLFRGISPQDIAYTIQHFTEERVTNYINQNVPNVSESNIALAGGLFANIKLNQKIKNMGFKKIFIHPAMGDDGLSLGAALWYLGNERKIRPFRLRNVFFGPSFSNNEIENILEKRGLPFEYVENINERIAELLVKGHVVARFTGRMEYGPRALGNRSILYQSTDPSVNDWLNKKLSRTEFMPFAPATLQEYAEKCYKNCSGSEYTAQFMTITFECREYMKKISPAAVHVDNTARPQLVNKKSNPDLHEILSHYFRLTGNPSIINTSFNLHGEPIVCTPEHALMSFNKIGLDYLAIENYLVTNDK